MGKVMKTEITNIKKNYGKKAVLDGVSLSADSGEIIGIIGGNGSGKSTLLTILAGIVKGDGGAFLYGGKNLFENKKAREKVLGFVPQSTPLLEELSAFDNLRLWYSKKDMEKELEEGVLKSLGIDEFIKTPVNKMSGGMKKRLSIGCAVAHNPEILLLDEPSASLDLICREKIADYLKSFTRRGGTAILVTHETSEFELCDKIFILKEGKLSPFEFNGNIKRLVDSL